MRRIQAMTGLAALMAASAFAATERVPGIDRNKFHISCFSFSQPAQTREHIREAKECGLDYVGGNIPYPSCPALDAFEEVGLDANVFFLTRDGGRRQTSEELRKKWPLEKLERQLDEFNASKPNSAIRLMNICDEPGTISMEFLGDVVRLVDRKCPHTRAYVNLLPNYATASESSDDVKKSQLCAPNYKAYIDEYCRLVPTTYIAYDHYPIFKSRAQTRALSPRWYANLKVVADACRRTDRDLWVGPQVNSRPGGRPLSENDLRYQAFSAMAFGAVNLTWACWTLGWWDNCVMETNGTLTCQYQKLKNVNGEIRTLAEHYMKLRNVATHFVGFTNETAALARYEIVPVARVDAAGVTGLAATDGSSLVVGEMVSRKPDCDVRGLFVFGANDCTDERGERHVVRFSAPGRIRALGPRGEVDVKGNGAEDRRFELVDNGAVLLLLKP